MTERSPLERRRVAGLAGHIGDSAGARGSLPDPDPLVRAAGLRSLARLDDLNDETLARALVDESPHVRITALELSSDRESPPIDHLLHDGEPTVVETAAWACGERDATDPIVATLSDLASGHDDPLVRESSVAALGALGHPSGLAAILAATEDKPAVRRRAVVALAAFDGPEVDAAWERARTDRDRQVRDAVDELLGPASDTINDGAYRHP